MSAARRAPIPENVKAIVRLRAKNRCESCGHSGRLEFHHLTYMRWDIPIFGYETPDDLELLCRPCHLNRHIGPEGEFYRDPEECAAEWDYYEHVMMRLEEQ